MSGYERAQLLELRIARCTAWLGFITILPVLHYWGALYAIMLVFFACAAAKCEATAEHNLKAIFLSSKS